MPAAAAVLARPAVNGVRVMAAGDEVSNAELARRLDSFSREVHTDLAELIRRLDAYVLREVYAADQRRREDQIVALEKQISDERALREAAVTTERQAREQSQERLRITVRWLVSALILPIGVLLVQIWLSTRGGGA